jgi:EpsI family protein
LLLEIHILARVSGKAFSAVLSSPLVMPEPRPLLARSTTDIKLASPLRLLCPSLLFLCAAGVAAFFISDRSEISLDRLRFITFPNQIGSWQGRPSLLDPEAARSLVGLDDYILSDYKGLDEKIVNLYVGYYSSQKKRHHPHLPSDCIPASGWQIIQSEQVGYTDKGVTLPLNRLIIEKKPIRQLVYYWFDQGGRNVADIYAARWYFHADAVLKNRTDGGLIRLVTQIHDDETERSAEERLQAFMRDAFPILSDYLPAEAPTSGQN